MISIDGGNIADDYTQYGRVRTDHKTVGGFMVEAAKIFNDVRICIDENNTFEFKGCIDVKIKDDTEIESVRYVDFPYGYIKFFITTKPEPEHIMREGWIAIYKGFEYDLPRADANICDTREKAEHYGRIAGNGLIDVVKIRWKEELR